MSPEDAHTLVGFLKGAFPSMTEEQMGVYEASLLDEDAKLASRAILDGIKEWTYTPKYAEIMERIRMLRRAGAARAGAPPELSRGDPPPFWVKRWIVARYIADPPDRRPFREEGYPEWVVPEEGWMPEDAYVEEAEMLTSAQLNKALASSLGVGR